MTKNSAVKSRKRSKKKRSRRFLFGTLKHMTLAGFAFILAGITFAVTMDKIVMPLYQRIGVEIHTPKLTGRTLDDAERLAKKLKLSIVQDTLEYHNNVPKNVISFQYPPPGNIVKPKRKIHVTVSKGPRPILMPSVIGMSPMDAELKVKASGLQIEATFKIRSNRYTRGIVAGQDPQGGQEVPENTGVVLYISNGLPETNVMMPDLVELSLSAACDTLRAYKFNLDFLQVQYEDAPEMLPETVIDQHPGPGVLTNTNSEITLDVSSSE